MGSVQINIRIRRGSLLLWVLITSLCILGYTTDLMFGDGDGIIEKLHFNPLIYFLLVSIVLGCFIAITYSKLLISKIALSVLTIFLSLGIAEFTLTIFYIQIFGGKQVIESEFNKPVITNNDEVYFKNYYPNVVFKTHVMGKDGNFSVLNKINSDGYRGPERILTSTSGKNILLLGDSFMQADEVPFENTIGQVLQDLFADSVSVIQHGIPSWSPLLELNWLLHKGIDFELDRVILFLFYNDFLKGDQIGDEGYTKYCQFDEKGYPLRFIFPSERTRNPWRDLCTRVHYLRLYKLLRSVINRANLSIDSAEQLQRILRESPKKFESRNDGYGLFAVMRDTLLWSRETKTRVDTSLEYLMLMNRLLKEHEMDFDLTLIPHQFQFKGENQESRKRSYGDIVFPVSGVERKIRKFCEKNSVGFIPLYEHFLEYKSRNSELLYFPYDGHWNIKGHRLAAEVVHSYLTNSTFHE
ncbi:hypothetical protein [Algoriphagus sp.]|uniref:hypothetical protein n=1 Tax=Algoriphagus sp. TaxID=1872435 RepID=UPI0025EC00DD|nr:hypothetical protein [Algoriphagus sp.]